MSSATPKDPEDHGKQLWWMTEEFFPGDEKPLHNSWPDQEHISREVGICVSKSTIKRRLHQSEYRVFTTRCKPLVSLKNRNTRLEFAKHLKSLYSSGPTSYGQIRQRSTCTRMMGREKYGEERNCLMIQNIPPHQ